MSGGFDFGEFCATRDERDGAPLNDRVRATIARIQNGSGSTVILLSDEAKAIVGELLALRVRVGERMCVNERSE